MSQPTEILPVSGVAKDRTDTAVVQCCSQLDIATLFFVENVIQTGILDHKPIKQWSEWKILLALQNMDPVGWLPQQIAQIVKLHLQKSPRPHMNGNDGLHPNQILAESLTLNTHCPRDGCYGEDGC